MKKIHEIKTQEDLNAFAKVFKFWEGKKIEEFQAFFETEDVDIPFERIRRITGYLVGDRDTRFNNAKRAEEKDRVKHTITSQKSVNNENYKGD